ncbi:Transcriptional regulatory protein SrrA [Roseovarius gaetbuli]|uniref:Transcriptional regulatory protein SrrA n=1 Tax=Roseovarius gaetbuli TaxID=1356575 RepID=A0A1X7A9X1_9RHOB|nr:response regulator [Roseovarius gaetbuli]SLN73605.1 Transcriptional regulatory protein SrrA [Roseovarius gaetbuli]
MSIEGNSRFQRKMEIRANKQSGFRILVVDDEPSILEVVKTALETLEDYQVSTASNAASALDVIQGAEKPFDCILLDIQMPDMNGIDLLRQLRVIPEYVETPVLMLTAMSDRKYIDDAFAEGATDYVNKPFDFLELRSRIKCAYSLVQSRRKTEKSMQCASDLKCKLETIQQLDFEDPISLNGLKNFLRYIEFDNYAAQLARRKMFGSQAISVILQDADLFYHHVGCEGFRDAIQDVASCIQGAADDMDFVFSYRGKGVFLIILHGQKVTDSILGTVSLGEMIGAQLRQHVTDERVEVLAGEPVSMRLLSRSTATGALKRAIDCAKDLETEIRKNDYAKSFDVDGYCLPPKKGKKRVYERVLRELFGEDSYLNIE